MRWFALLGAGLVSAPLAALAAEPTVEHGEHISIIGGCHDCHTAGYNETAGKIDPATALIGTSVGWNGPWGTTYSANLRLTVRDMSEDEFADFASSFETRPPMPYFNVHALSEHDTRSLYLYIKSLGDPGEPVPEYVPPGETPKTPYIVMAPPTMP